MELLHQQNKKDQNWFLQYLSHHQVSKLLSNSDKMAVKFILNNARQKYLTYNMFREQPLKEKHKLLSVSYIM